MKDEIIIQKFEGFFFVICAFKGISIKSGSILLNLKFNLLLISSKKKTQWN